MLNPAVPIKQTICQLCTTGFTLENGYCIASSVTCTNGYSANTLPGSSNKYCGLWKPPANCQVVDTVG